MKTGKIHSIALCLVHFIPIVLAMKTAPKYIEAAIKDITLHSNSKSTAFKCLNKLKGVKIANLQHKALGQGIAEELIKDEVFDNNVANVYNLGWLWVIKFAQGTAKVFATNTETTDADYKFLSNVKQSPKILGVGIGVCDGKIANRKPEYLWVFITGNKTLDLIHEHRQDIKISARLTILAILAARQMRNKGKPEAMKVLSGEPAILGQTWISNPVSTNANTEPVYVYLTPNPSQDLKDAYCLRGYAFWGENLRDIYALCVGIPEMDTNDSYDMPQTTDALELVPKKKETSVPDPANAEIPGKNAGIGEKTTTQVSSTYGDSPGNPGVTGSSKKPTNTETESPTLPETGIEARSDPSHVVIDLAVENPEGAENGVPEIQQATVPGEIQTTNAAGTESQTLANECQMSPGPDGDQPAEGATLNDIVIATDPREVETGLGKSSGTENYSTEKETLNTKTSEEETEENVGENYTVNDNKTNLQPESSTMSTQETKGEPKIKSLRDRYLLAVSLTRGVVPLNSTSKQPSQLSRPTRSCLFRSSTVSNTQPIGQNSRSNDRLHQSCDTGTMLRRNNSMGGEKKQTGSGLWNGDEETVTTILKDMFPNRPRYPMVTTDAARIVVEEWLRLPIPQSVCDLRSGPENQLYVVKYFDLFESQTNKLRSTDGFKKAASLTLTAWKEEVCRTEFWTHLERGVKEGNAKVQWGDRASGSVRIGIALLSHLGANQLSV